MKPMFSSPKDESINDRVISVGCTLLQNMRNTLQNVPRATVANAAKKKICSTAYSKKQEKAVVSIHNSMHITTRQPPKLYRHQS